MSGSSIGGRVLRSVLLLLFMACSSLAWSSTDTLFVSLLRECVEKQIVETAGVTFDNNKDAEYLQKAEELGYGKEEARIILNQYRGERFEQLRWAFINVQFGTTCTTEDFRFALDYFDCDKGRQAIEHFSMYDGDEFQEKLYMRVMPKIWELLFGKKKKIKEKSTTPKTYQKLFQKYMKSSGLMDRPLSEFFDDQLGEQERNGKMKAVNDYLYGNVLVLIMDVCYPTVTEDDLRFKNEFFETQSGKRIRKGTAVLMKASKLFEEMVDEDYEEYIQDCYKNNPPAYMKSTPMDAEIEEGAKG